jgi:hypothetical protein
MTLLLLAGDSTRSERESGCAMDCCVLSNNCKHQVLMSCIIVTFDFDFKLNIEFSFILSYTLYFAITFNFEVFTFIVGLHSFYSLGFGLLAHCRHRVAPARLGRERPFPCLRTIRELDLCPTTLDGWLRGDLCCNSKQVRSHENAWKRIEGFCERKPAEGSELRVCAHGG